MTAYYNDHDPKAAAWLRELIKAGRIADGEVDERSILDVQPVDLAGFSQCHFFAGLGGWSYALRLAGIPDDFPVWTGSPPCQPFSAAGRQLGRDDARHLSPKFAALVGACRPRMLFGEQVASAEVFGKAPKTSRKGIAEQPQWAWLDDLSDRLEAARYAVGASDIPAAGVGAPHIRQRTFFGAVRLDWLADASGAGSLPGAQRRIHRCQKGHGPWHGKSERSGQARGLADASGERLDGIGVCLQRGRPQQAGSETAGRGGDGWLADAGFGGQQGQGFLGRSGNSAPQADRKVDGAFDDGRCGWLADAGRAMLQPGERLGCDAEATGPAAGKAWQLQRGGAGDSDGCTARGLAAADGRDASAEGLQRSGEHRQQPHDSRSVQVDHGEWTSPSDDPWGFADWLFCRDGKWRPVIPSFIAVAYGLSDRMVLCCDGGYPIEKEEINGPSTETGASSPLSSMRGSNAENPLRGEDGGFGRIYAEGLLRARLHGGGHEQGDMPEREPQQVKGNDDHEGLLRDMRQGRETSRPPSGRKPFQQRPVKLEDVVSELPSQIALAELHRRHADAQALRSLQRAVHQSGALCDTSDAAASAWASIGQEGQDRLRLDFADTFVRVSFSPLSQGEPARVGRLRGYGNAIVPQAAAAFVQAFCEVAINSYSAGGGE